MAPERAGSWGVPAWIRKVGLISWLILGIGGALTLGALAIALTRGVTIPLVMAVVVGAVFVPWVDGLQKLKVPRWAGSLLVVLFLLAVAAGTIAIVVAGLINNAAEIADNVDAGVAHLRELLASDLPSQIVDQAAASEDALGGGLVGLAVGGLSSAVSFVVGGFVALNALFFLMKDAHTISTWMRERASGVVATTLLGDSARALRAYFRGKTVVATSSSVTVYLGALILGVPLAGSIALVTFITSFIPYLGAFIAGAFAVLLAIGEGGVPLGLGILAFVILANAVVESLVTPLAIGSSLNLHPLVILVVTLLGGVVAGFVGITLAAPLTAIGVQVVAKLRAAGAFDDEPTTEPVSRS